MKESLCRSYFEMEIFLVLPGLLFRTIFIWYNATTFKQTISFFWKKKKNQVNNKVRLTLKYVSQAKPPVFIGSPCRSENKLPGAEAPRRRRQGRDVPSSPALPPAAAPAAARTALPPLYNGHRSNPTPRSCPLTHPPAGSRRRGPELPPPHTGRTPQPTRRGGGRRRRPHIHRARAHQVGDGRDPAPGTARHGMGGLWAPPAKATPVLILPAPQGWEEAPGPGGSRPGGSGGAQRRRGCRAGGLCTILLPWRGCGEGAGRGWGKAAAGAAARTPASSAATASRCFRGRSRNLSPLPAARTVAPGEQDCCGATNARAEPGGGRGPAGPAAVPGSPRLSGPRQPVALAAAPGRGAEAGKRLTAAPLRCLLQLERPRPSPGTCCTTKVLPPFPSHPLLPPLVREKSPPTPSAFKRGFQDEILEAVSSQKGPEGTHAPSALGSEFVPRNVDPVVGCGQRQVMADAVTAACASALPQGFS